jgi:hypothetical protein
MCVIACPPLPTPATLAHNRGAITCLLLPIPDHPCNPLPRPLHLPTPHHTCQPLACDMPTQHLPIHSHNSPPMHGHPLQPQPHLHTPPHISLGRRTPSSATLDPSQRTWLGASQPLARAQNLVNPWLGRVRVRLAQAGLHPLSGGWPQGHLGLICVSVQLYCSGSCMLGCCALCGAADINNIMHMTWLSSWGWQLQGI